MATLRDISRRIKAVKNTRQITKAMKMVAAAKLRRAQGRMLDLRSYADKMADAIARLASASEDERHPLLAKRPTKAIEVLVMTSDRGLCGAFNTNIMKAATALLRELERNEVDSVSGGPAPITLSLVGRKARDYYKHRGIAARKVWSGLGVIEYSDAQEIAAEMMDRYVKEEVDRVYLVYNKFKNVAQQEVQVIKLLPTVAVAAEKDASAGYSADYIFEPEESALLDELLPKNIEIQVYRALLESQASEEAARMTAMENATKSANEMIGSLTLKYNKARQSSITAELMDIVGGVEALKG